MAWREGRKKSGGFSLDLRLTPQDRTGGPPNERAGGRAEPARRRRESSPPRQPKKRKSGKRRSGFTRMVYWGFVLLLWGVIAGIGALVWIGVHLPPIQSLEIPKRPPSVLILGLNGATLATRGDMGGAAVPLSELPAYVPKAFVAIEDRRFYSHFGIDPLGIMRAIGADILRRGASQGGSTITQQLAKNLFLTQERTISRKVQEVVLALWLEHKFTKAQILELYLNRVYFGAGAYGVEGAAQRYFGKSARQPDAAGSRDAGGPRAIAVAARAEPQSRRRRTPRRDGARRHGRAEDDHRRCREAALAASGARGAAVRRRLGQLRRRLGDGRGRRPDRQVRQDIVVETTIDPALQSAAEQALDDTLAQKGDKLNVGARRAGGHDARRRGARDGRRPQLRREPIQPRHRRQAPARLVVQALRLSHRARARADARQRARRRADPGQRLEAGKFRARNMSGR